MVDVVVGLALAVAVLPMVVLSAVVVAVTLRTWPFFAQTRIGRNGRPFRFVKLRTLPRSIPPYTDKYALAEVKIPAFCRLLRDFHLDELPQLWLVVIGKMSLVGPRPEMPHLHRGMDGGFAALRTRIRPGCTGLWQISQGATRLIHETPEYDIHYVRSASMRLDLWIVLRTVALVLPGAARRLVTLHDIPSWASNRKVLDLTDVSLAGAVRHGDPVLSAVPASAAD